jgi:hypothetical protein
MKIITSFQRLKQVILEVQRLIKRETEWVELFQSYYSETNHFREITKEELGYWDAEVYTAFSEVWQQLYRSCVAEIDRMIFCS